MAHELRPNRLLTSMDYAPRYEFQKCVARYRGDYQQKGFSCWDQFLAMAFAQLTYRESLRASKPAYAPEVRSQKALPHGIPKQGGADDTGRRQRAARLADLCGLRTGPDRHGAAVICRRPHRRRVGSRSVCRIPPLTCVFHIPMGPVSPAQSRGQDHTLLDLHGNIPAFIHVTDGKV